MAREGEIHIVVVQGKDVLKEQRQIRLYFVKFQTQSFFFASVYLEDIFISLLPLFLAICSPLTHLVPDLTFSLM